MLGCLTRSPCFGTTPAQRQHRGWVAAFPPRPKTTETLLRCGPRHGGDAACTPGPASCTEPNQRATSAAGLGLKSKTPQSTAEHKPISN